MPEIHPFGEKATAFISRPPEEDALINILSGSIRSGKTWASNAKLLYILSRGFWPGGVGLITGNTLKSVHTNIISDLVDWANSGKQKRAHYSSGNGLLTLFDRPFLVTGASDEQAYKQIKGSTVGIWIADEITLSPRSFFDMAVSRLSLPMSRCYATTNPDNPYHYLKTEWLDSAEKKANGEVWSDTFTLDDNPNIEEDKKNSFKRMFTGVFYQRNILGLWVIAQGKVYGSAIGPHTWYTDATRKQGLLSKNGHMDRFVGVDAGTINACCMLDIYDDGKVLWVEKEYYWSSLVESRQKTNSEYVQDFLQMFCEGQSPQHWPIAVIDPSAASLKVEFNKVGVVVINADNAVSEGIRVVGSLLSRGAIRIHERCKNLVKEMETYAWDESAAKLGIEKPIKQNDHSCFVAGTKIRTPLGQRNIENLQVGDEVVTPLGTCKITGYSIRENQITVEWNGTFVTLNHKVICEGGNLVPVCELTKEDKIYKWHEGYLQVSILPRNYEISWVRKEAAQHAVLSGDACPVIVEPVSTVHKVYNLSTEHGCYFANDVLVSNCDALRYGVYTKIPLWRVAV